MKRISRLVLALILGIPPITALAAGSGGFTQVVVLGDSLSDTGNLFAATGYPPLPYYMGRSSNGPLAVEHIADSYGVPLANFAWYGATTGVGNNQDGGTQSTLGNFTLPGVLTAYESAKTSGLFPIDPNALYVVWAGPNDFVSNGPTVGTVLTAVSNIVFIVKDLQRHGAKHILVPGIPDLSLTPFVQEQGPEIEARVSALSNAFNALLVLALPRGAIFYATAALFRQVLWNPASFGFANVTDACFDPDTFSLCANPDQYIFWDVFHPTAAVHSVLGDAFARCAKTPRGRDPRFCVVAPGLFFR
jgi:phospholipase/lecithinase/hemolysin